MTLHRKARPTIRDVAAAAGVAVGTASRALNRSGRVSADAVAAVTQVMASSLVYFSLIPEKSLSAP